VVEGVRGRGGNKEIGEAPQFISLQTIKLTDNHFPSSEYKIVLFLETISA
jgi:hypothetical protein